MCVKVLASQRWDVFLRHGVDRFTHFCTAYGRVSSGMPGHVLSSSNCPFAWGIWAHRIRASLSPPESITQTASRSVQPFCTSSCQNIVGHVWACPPPKIAPTYGEYGPSSNSGSLGPSKPTTQTATRSVQPFLHRWAQSDPILHNGTLFSSQNSPFPWGRSGPPSNAWFPPWTHSSP